MNIVAIGPSDRFLELSQFFASREIYSLSHFPDLPPITALDAADVIIDLDFDNQIENFRIYALLKGKSIWLHSLKLRLSELLTMSEEINCHVAGLNFLPSFINRSIWEVSLLNAADKSILEQAFSNLAIPFRWVDDRVGLVSARIVCMIINEACFTLQEGTASITDIDTGMKLGTNYPLGPFEWADRIGIKEVYSLLDALFRDTAEERYKICPLLKTYALRSQSFYK